MSDWIAPLIGRPWEAGAEGPEAFDCRGLVRWVQQRHFNRELPRLLVTEAEARGAALRAGWRTVTKPAHEGDVLLVYGARGPHVGTFVRYGALGLGVLHSVQPPAAVSGVCFHQLDDLLVGGAFGRPSIWRHLGAD